VQQLKLIATTQKEARPLLEENMFAFFEVNILSLIYGINCMNKLNYYLDSLIFEIRYASGHLYFDRCGQCLLDIERNCDGWIVSQVDVQSGRLENVERSFTVNFNNTNYNFSARKPDEDNIADIAKEISKLWKIIQANLGLDDLLRVGCRLVYLLPTMSIEESERRLGRSDYNIRTPEAITELGFMIKTRDLTTVFFMGDDEYRVRQYAGTRYEAVDPSSLLKTEPRFLSKNQNRYRIEKIKKLAQYSANPMYGVFLDIDCSRAHPEIISFEEYIVEQYIASKKIFLPMLDKI